MDRTELDAPRHRGALRGLSRLNSWSRAAVTIWQPVAQLARECQRPLRVLDVATGGGDILLGLSQRARRADLAFDFAGCDISPRALEFAREQADRHKINISFITLDVLRDPLPRDYDVVMSSLFLHHLTDEQAVSLLRRMADACREMVVISDLRRSRRGLWLAYAASRFLTRSPVVHADGPQSVLNAFTSSEVRRLADQAGLARAQIKDCWPQRFLLRWRKGQNQT
jgi:2-polyprenyl-3-methyl-5-hydroxy-6-metoxy-1,4-benzoquinol methylase